MKKTIGYNRPFFIIPLLMFLFYNSSVFAKPKTIKYNNSVYYQGEVEKRQPSGEGTIIVGSRAFSISNNLPDAYDKITGTFEGLSVKNGVLQLSTGVVFKGDFSIEITDNTVIYDLSKGVFSGLNYNCSGDRFNTNRKGPIYKFGVSLPLQEPIQIRRNINGQFFSLQAKEFVSELSIEVNRDQFLENIDKRHPKPSEYAYSIAFAFVDKEMATFHFKVKAQISHSTEMEEGGVYLDRDNIISGAYSRIVKNLDADEVSISFDDKYYCTYTYRPDHDKLIIKCTNGDSLEKVRNGEDENLTLKKTILNGGASYTIECFNNKETIPLLPNGGMQFWAINQKNIFYNQYDYITEYLGSYISNDTKERIHKAYEGVKKYNMLISNNTYLNNSYKYTFSDGSFFIGYIYSTDIIDVLLSKDKPNNKNNWLCGIHVLPTNEQTIYLKGENGWTLNELEKSIKKEEGWIEEKEQEEKAAEERERQRWDEMCKRYGREYVEAIYYNNKILAGTPEQLLKESVSNLKLVYESNSIRKYEVYNNWKTDLLMKVTVNVSTRKVTSVVYY